MCFVQIHARVGGAGLAQHISMIVASLISFVRNKRESLKKPLMVLLLILGILHQPSVSHASSNKSVI